RQAAACFYPGASLLLILAAGCRDEDHSHPHAPDDHEDRTAQKTVWTDRFEVFLEHQLVAAGTPTTFVTHVTDLETQEPRREGAVRFVLQLGSDPPVEHVDPAPVRPGIYTPRLTFPRVGEWKVTLHIPAASGGRSGESIAGLGEIMVYASHEETHQATEPAAPEGISFLKEQQWKLRAKIEPVLGRRMIERVRVPGRVAARPGSRAALTPPLAGRLLPPPGGEMPSLGARVEAGQTLALIQPPFSDFLVKLVESEAGVTRARLALELAELADARVQKLAGEQLRSAREREEADFALRTARANHESALALQAAYQKAGALFVPAGESSTGAPGLPTLELKAPLSGQVTQIAAAMGEHVPSDRPILHILDTGRVFIEASVPEPDLYKVVPPFAAYYELAGAPGLFEPLVAEGAGRVVFFGPEVDPLTRSVPLVYEVKNSSGSLRIGLALNVYLETGRAEDALAIPESAIVDEEGRPVAFVQVSGETFDKRYLTLGLRDGGFVEVREGLAEGERIVTREAYAVRLASVSSSIPAHGHSH
ncbi:MAG TPA: efflux RND transporter periplasmic adaptor subunit, partial [Candidatus Limnocylindrales bacterium]|nr:efflux RND transporter periplasmic adaptor subunit [Candidatus Limnocylindrales bacterium]